MKPFLPTQQALSRARQRGMSLVEMMTAASIFVIMIGALVSMQIFASRVYILGATKLTATADARETLNSIRDQVRAAKNVYVGNYTNGFGFSRIPTGNLQQGNALAITYTNTAATNYLVYYLDTTLPTNLLCSISNNLANTLTVQARWVTNYYCFFAEDYRGVVMSDYYNNPVFHIQLQFDQWEYPIGFIGTNAINAYDFYVLNARVMRRAKD